MRWGYFWSECNLYAQSNFGFIENLFKTTVYLSMSKISKKLFLSKYILRVIGKIMNKNNFEKVNKHNDNSTQDETVENS